MSPGPAIAWSCGRSRSATPRCGPSTTPGATTRTTASSGSSTTRAARTWRSGAMPGSSPSCSAGAPAGRHAPATRWATARPTRRPINGNSRASLSADDDGGYFRERAAAYYDSGGLDLGEGATPPPYVPPPPGPPALTWTRSASVKPTTVKRKHTVTSPSTSAPRKATKAMVDVRVYDPKGTPLTRADLRRPDVQGGRGPHLQADVLRLLEPYDRHIQGRDPHLQRRWQEADLPAQPGSDLPRQALTRALGTSTARPRTSVRAAARTPSRCHRGITARAPP